MKRYIVKQVIKYGILGIVLVFATMFVYDAGKESYQKYLNRHVDDEEWIKKNINLEENYKIGSGILQPVMPNDLKVSDQLYKEVMAEEINTLLINNYKIDNPLLIYNPFKEDEKTVNIYFYTGEYYKFEYHVTTQSINLEEEISYTRIQDQLGMDVLTNKHFYVLEGFVPGKKNNLLIRILDSNDQVINAENFILNLPSI